MATMNLTPTSMCLSGLAIVLNLIQVALEVVEGGPVTPTAFWLNLI